MSAQELSPVITPEDVEWAGGDGDFTVTQAQAITQAIKGTAERLWMLLEQAHDRRAWAALGYGTWEKYVTSEFNISRSRSYQILDLGHVTRAIESAIPASVDMSVELNERDARILKPHLEEVVEEIADRTDGASDQRQISEVITDVVAEVREHHAKAKEPAVDASAPLDQILGPRGDWDIPGVEGTSAPDAANSAVGVEYLAEDEVEYLAEDEVVPPATTQQDGEGEIATASGGIYQQVQSAAIGADEFTIALEQLASAPVDVDTLARVLPPAKREFVEAILPATLERLTELKALLSAQE